MDTLVELSIVLLRSSSLSCFTVYLWYHSVICKKKKTVFRIRIPVFFGLPDPDPLVRGMDPDPALDPDPKTSIINVLKTVKKFRT